MADNAPRLVRRPPDLAVLRLDSAQRAVVDLPAGSGPVVVLGAPGTGKTTTVVEAVVSRVERGTPASSVLILASSRTSAAAMRDRVTVRLARTVVEPMARTAASYAFALIRAHAVAAEEPLPRLISGPEQDAILRDLLAGHEAGEGVDPRWPVDVAPAVGLRGFRHELRDLLMRALERGLGPQELADWGRRVGRPEWLAAARVFEEYLHVSALAAPGGYDPAAILDAAVDLLESNPAALERERRRWSYIAVDDHHESGEAVARLLDVLAPRGSDLLLAGDPDATTQGFRGADPRLIAQAASRYRRLDGQDAPVHVLGMLWRAPTELRPVIAGVAASIGALGGGRQRVPYRAPPASGDHLERPAGGELGEVRVAVLSTAARQTGWIAHLLRDQHVLHDVGWDRMAVIVRTSGAARALRRALSAAGVPTAAGTADVPLRDEGAVAPLRLAMRVVLDPSSLDPEVAQALLRSALGGADAMALRRIRRYLVTAASSAGQQPSSSEELLAAVIRQALASGGLADVPVMRGAPRPVVEPLSRLTTVLLAGAEAAAAERATAESVLWSIWNASGLANRWRSVALAGGSAGRLADRDLDAVMALFEAAERFVDRLPGASPLAFLDLIESQEVPEDTLAEQAPRRGAVDVLTPQASAGGEWDVVVLAGIQDGVWPDTRLRGSFLGSTALVDLLTGSDSSIDGAGVPSGHPPSGGAATSTGWGRIRAARQQILDDERRLLYVAVSRSRRLLAACAVSTEDEQPSEFFDLIARIASEQAPPGRAAPDASASDKTGTSSSQPLGDYQPTAPGRPVTLAGVVAELRRTVLASQDPDERTDAAAELARLAAEGVPGADPAQWHGVQDFSDDAPLWAPDERVPVSPSALETYLACPLRWLLQRHGGQGSVTTRQSVGVLVHDVASTHPDAPASELEQARAQAFSQIGLPDGWIGTREDERSAAMVGKLAGYFAEATRDLVATELEFSVPIGRALLRGRVDRLERDEAGRLVVVDLKTGSRQPTKDELGEHPQLGAYQAAVEAGAFEDRTGSRQSGGAALVQLGGSQKKHVEQRQKALADSDNPTWASDMVHATAEGMAGREFPAVRSEGCRHCTVRTSCPLQPEGRVLR